MMEMKEKSQKTNLLIDSLSESDVPDLELIPPTKTKRKKFRKFQSSRGSGYSSPGGGGSLEDGYYEQSLPRCWTSLVSLLLFSLCVGLGILAWFALGLQKELRLLQELQAAEARNRSGANSQQPSAIPSNSPVSVDFAQHEKVLQKKLEELERKIEACHCSESVENESAIISTTVPEQTKSAGSNIDSNKDESITTLNAAISKLEKDVIQLKEKLVQSESEISTLQSVAFESTNATQGTVAALKEQQKTLASLKSCFDSVCSSTSSKDSTSATLAPSPTSPTLFQPRLPENNSKTVAEAKTTEINGDIKSSTTDGEIAHSAIQKRPSAGENNGSKTGADNSDSNEDSLEITTEEPRPTGRP